MFKRLDVIAALLIAATLFAASELHGREPFTLDSVRAQVVRDYGGVSQLSTQAFAARLARRPDVLLLDVREEDEYAVSHLADAVRVDPDIWRGTFMNRFGENVRGKTVVFYCSVGVRSSRLAERVRTTLKEQGAKAVYNLDGGIFAWHNERRPLVNAKGETDFVHPFDSYWGQLVKRGELARKSPE
ncbi:MAG: rhodanese-like domain-containing protein [Hyphomicrobiaceae bacterium]|nr:rhodanese-like domain-containing protein [Hyphomicrobiaceae bacterium]